MVQQRDTYASYSLDENEGDYDNQEPLQHAGKSHHALALGVLPLVTWWCARGRLPPRVHGSWVLL